jgi:hypothetical protein
MPRSPSRRLLASALAVALLVPALALGPAPLCDPPGDGITRALTAPYTHGVSTTVSATGIGALAGSPTVAKPVRFTLAKAAAVSAAGTITIPAQSAVYRATGSTANTLTGVTWESGVDQDFAAGDWIGFAGSARYITDINSRLRKLAASYVSVLDAGTVVGDGVADDGPAIQAILDANPGRRVYFPRTAPPGGADGDPSYFLGATTLTVSHPGTTLEGDGGGYGGGTVLRWAAKTPGIWVKAAGCTVRDLCLFGSERWDGVFYDQGVIPARRHPGLTEAAGASAADGVRVGQPYCRLSNLNIQFFGRDGVNCSAGDQDQPAGQGAEDCQFDRIFLGNNRGNGLKIQGGDSNCTQVNAATVFVNQFWGVRNEAFLAASFISPQATQNGWDNSENLTGGELSSVAVTSLTRASNTVTAVFPAAVFANDSAATPLVPGNGMRVKTCADASFIGRWRLLTVSGDSRTFTWRQVAADATATTATARANWLPPDATFTSAVRASNVVTLTFSGPYLTGATGHESATGQSLRVGQGVTLLNCPDASFNGTFILLSVDGPGGVVTYAQAGADATVDSGADRVARAAIPSDTWTAANIVGGSYYSSSNAARTVWINPYAEGGQVNAFASSNVIIAPTWGDNPSFDWVAPDGSAATGLPLILYGTAPGTGGPATSTPVGVVSQLDRAASTITRIGLTAPQVLYDYLQHPVSVAGVNATFWTAIRGPDEWTLWRGDPSQPGATLRLRFNVASGYTYLDSEGGGMVRVNADASTGTGGLLVGDGTGGASATTIVGGNVTATGVIATGSGPTGSRPTATAAGQQWFDTTLGLPLWWSGANWRDAAGAVR